MIFRHKVEVIRKKERSLSNPRVITELGLDDAGCVTWNR
jgi:hypothetical protein